VIGEWRFFFYTRNAAIVSGGLVLTKIICAINHPREHSANGLIATVKFGKMFLRHVLIVERVIQPRLCFVCLAQCFVDLINECSFISAARSRFRNHGFNRTGTSPNLIS